MVARLLSCPNLKQQMGAMHSTLQPFCCLRHAWQMPPSQLGFPHPSELMLRVNPCSSTSAKGVALEKLPGFSCFVAEQSRARKLVCCYLVVSNTAANWAGGCVSC